MKPFNFRRKVLLLAVTLVTVIELGTLFPVLGAIERDAGANARRSVDLAGVVFDEYMLNRTAQLATTVDAVAADFPFREAVAVGDPQSVLANHAARAGASLAVVHDLDGNVMAAAGAAAAGAVPLALPQSANVFGRDEIRQAVATIGGTAYQTFTVPVRAPVTIAWVTFGFPIGEELALAIEALTALDATFVTFGVDDVRVLASTLPDDAQDAAIAGIHLGHSGAQAQSVAQHDYLTELRPIAEGASDLYVALQLSMREATASYRHIRNILLLITSASLLLAVGGAFWVAGMVTRPVQHLAAAARRMREGVYTQPLAVASSDELGELAAGFNSMQDAIADREQRIFHIAHHDSLSGLPTRSLVVSRLRAQMGEAAKLTVVNLTLSRFDGIASSLGHGTADEVVALVADLLRSVMGPEQTLGHLNYHEFVAVLPDQGVEQARRFVETLADRLRAGVVVKGANVSLQARAGIASYPEHGTDAGELLRCAAIARDDAQHRHEQIGEYRPGQEDRAVEIVRIVGDFPRAVQNDELELWFQPKIDCNTRALVGAEALVRWRHPELGLLSPDKFVGPIEQTGGVAHLTRWVLRRALMSCAAWRARGVSLGIAVNISVDDLVDEYLPYYLLELTSRHGLKPADVTLEVTESAIMHNIQTSLSVVSCMREVGFRLAIDDFGTGQSAMSQLKRLPVDELKIDKSFVLNMENRGDEAIVRTSIELAHQFDLHVVAEGVESPRALERLQSLGCEYAQGFLISKPLTADALEEWAKRWAAGEGADLVTAVAAGAPVRRGAIA